VVDQIEELVRACRLSPRPVAENEPDLGIQPALQDSFLHELQ
jgi:hypothetical protein